MTTLKEYLPTYSITFSALPFGGSMYVIHVLLYSGSRNLLNDFKSLYLQFKL